MKNISFIAALLFPLLSWSQSALEKVRQHPDVEWAFQTSLIYDFDISLFQKGKRNELIKGNAITYIKQDFIELVPIVAQEASPMEIAIWNMIDDNLDQVYTLEGLPMSLNDLDKAITRVDTIISFDPDTYEEEITVARNKTNFRTFELDQIWYYSKKKQQLFSVIAAIKPIIFGKDKEVYKPFCFKPTINLKGARKYNLNNKDFNSIVAISTEIDTQISFGYLNSSTKSAIQKTLWDSPLNEDSEIYYGKDGVFSQVPTYGMHLSDLLHGEIDTIFHIILTPMKKTLKLSGMNHIPLTYWKN